MITRQRTWLLFLLPLALGACGNLPLNRPAGWETPTSAPGDVATVPDAPTQDGSSGTAEAVNELVTSSRAARANGDYTHALADVERAVRIEPRNPYLWIELGEIHLLADDPRRAASMARKAMSVAGDDRSAKAAAENLLERASGT